VVIKSEVKMPPYCGSYGGILNSFKVSVEQKEVKAHKP